MIQFFTDWGKRDFLLECSTNNRKIHLHFTFERYLPHKNSSN